MSRAILKCTKCSSYTLDENCECGGKASSPKPAKYSPDDKYAKYRREVKRDELEKRGLL